jgi:hypothetical protein
LAVPGGARLLVITKGSEAESPGTIRKLAPAGVHTILSSDAWRDFNIPVAPFFVLVDGTTNKVIGEGAASTWEQVSDLMAQSLVDLDDAGMHTNASTRPTLGRAQDRPSRVDADLRAAGIEPGHPSLHPGRDG